MITSRCTLTALLLTIQLSFSLPYHSSPSLLSFLSQLSSSIPCHSSPTLFVATALHSSPSLHSFPPCILADISSHTHIFLSSLLLSHYPQLSSFHTCHSSPHFMDCLVTSLLHHLSASLWYMSPSIESLSSWLGAMLLHSKPWFPFAVPPGPFPSSSNVNWGRGMSVQI